ncbi:fungal-specific transcription factor domain-containing protein [Gilbertella persicaria]|uniref:fungal-specific transcription factor domain-containing protein n=1 Tax=Gilbertella persicaria TaxID=101096 RepID=UPI0022200205|nr:fungal-specific transcription factor domain-containing protein [Gilbertella persicaria]KAI8085762.1 fungal-specific transcription factor domain-containing protein [Gilbertella persicaria]
MSTSSDEAANKRQRVSRACDLCRKKKIKCNGESPICGNCKAFHLACSYKDTTKKRGPPKGYIEAIENRLHKLEGFLHDIANENDPRTIELLQELQAPLETPTGEQINTRPQRRQKRRQTKKDPIDSPISVLYSPTLSHSELDNTSTIGSPSPHQEGLVGSLTMDENGLVRYLGKSSGFYLLSNSRTYQNGTFHFSGYRHKHKSYDEDDSRSEKRHVIDPLELPPKDLSEHLIVLYFTHFYPILPLFYKRKLGCVKSPSSPVSPLLLNAIYALASRVSPDKRVRSDPHAPDTAGDIFFERARCLLDEYYDTPRISTIQALLLMASHQMGAMKPARGWLYSGMAFRMAQDLGLNRNCDHWSILPEERERRKRVFWCCYVVDRITSAIYGRSSNFEERDCDVPFPSVDDDEPIRSKEDSSRPSAGLLQVFIETIKVCDILGHVLKNIYYVKAKYHTTDPQHIDHILTTLNRQLTEWHAHLPEALQYQPPNTQNGEKGPDPPAPICQLHLMYYTTMILLHRSFIPGPTQKQLPISLPSYKICESAATSILDIVNIMLSENHLRYMYNFSVFYVFTAGIIFIKLASSDDAGRSFDAKLNVNRVMRALDELENTWLNAARCSNILGELAGLRDIKLERDKYVPRQISKSSPPPSIAVPNSPILSTTVLPKQADDKDMTYSWPPHQQIYMHNISSVRQSVQDNTSKEEKGYFDMKTTLDPFEAPGIIPHSQPQEFDLLETAFWGMPTSLDTHEWDAYFGNLTNQRQEKQQVESYLLSSDTSSTLQQQAASFMFTSTPQEHQRQSSTNSATSADIPHSPSQSILFGFMNNRQQQQQHQQQQQQQQQEPILVSSPTSMMQHAFSPSLNTPHKPTNVLYW